jgi:hypothetical protein
MFILLQILIKAKSTATAESITDIFLSVIFNATYPPITFSLSAGVHEAEIVCGVGHLYHGGNALFLRDLLQKLKVIIMP